LPGRERALRTAEPLETVGLNISSTASHVASRAGSASTGRDRPRPRGSCRPAA